SFLLTMRSFNTASPERGLVITITAPSGCSPGRLLESPPIRITLPHRPAAVTFALSELRTPRRTKLTMTTKEVENLVSALKAVRGATDVLLEDVARCHDALKPLAENYPNPPPDQREEGQFWL